MDELVSIVINATSVTGLSITLDSVLNQTYKNVEYIVIHTGHVEEFHYELKSSNRDIIFLVSDLSRSIYSAFNKGIKAAKGSYILFLNSGDYICSNEVIELLVDDHNKDLDVIYGKYQCALSGKLVSFNNIPIEITIDSLLRSKISPAALIFKKEIFIKFDMFDESLKFVSAWAFLLKSIILGNARCEFRDVNVAVLDSKGLNINLSDEPFVEKERHLVIKTYFSSYLQEMISQNQFLSYYYDKYKIKYINSILKLVKLALSSIAFSFYKIISLVKYFINSWISELELKHYKNRNKLACYDIPIIINNRNHLTYLKRLISSLEVKGFKNIYIIDNDSSYLPLVDYYNSIPYKVYFLRKNVGFCALWDTDIFNDFKDQYYVYTDSDLELIEECPSDFMVVMHYLLNKYKSLGKVGFSLLTNDLPSKYDRRDEVKRWESQWSERKIEKLAYYAQIDTTFALYKPNCYGHATMLSALRTCYPYSARHLPWYEDSKNLTYEQKYYYDNAATSSHWSSKMNFSKL